MKKSAGIPAGLALVLSFCLAGWALYAAVEHYSQLDWREHLIERKGQLSAASVTSIENGPRHALFELDLESDRGVRARGYMRMPGGRGPFPVLLILGGLRTGKRTVDYISDAEGVVLVALDYPYEGEKQGLSPWEFSRRLPRMRRAVIDTPAAVMLCVDYLSSRSGVDADRIILVGGSLGAFFAPAAAAIDDRIAAVALLFGGADLQTVALANLDVPAPLDRIAAWLLAVLASPVAPSKYVGHISPRPLFFLNGTGDPRIPERCARLLHESAGPPATIRWIPAGHVDVRDREFGRVVVAEFATWLSRHDLIASESLDDAVAP
jgi:dienelactone hydrolase